MVENIFTSSLVTILLAFLAPAGAFFYIVKKNMKIALIFSFLTIGIGNVVKGVISMFGLNQWMNNLITPISVGILSVNILTALITLGITVFLTLYLMNEKRGIREVSFLAGLIVVAQFIAIAFIVSQLENIGLLSIIA